MARSEPPSLADSTTNELLAMLEVMFIAAIADRNFSAEERRNFLEHAQSLSGGLLDSTHLVPLVASWEKRDLQDIDERLLELSRDLPDETARRIAYGLACGVTDADGQVAPSEVNVLTKIAAAFALDEAEEEEIARSVRMSSAPPGERDAS
jgi:tellurite resistance protein